MTTMMSGMTSSSSSTRRRRIELSSFSSVSSSLSEEEATEGVPTMMRRRRRRQPSSTILKRIRRRRRQPTTTLMLLLLLLLGLLLVDSPLAAASSEVMTSGREEQQQQRQRHENNNERVVMMQQRFQHQNHHQENHDDEARRTASESAGADADSDENHQQFPPQQLKEENGLLVLSPLILTDTDSYAQNVVFAPDSDQSSTISSSSSSNSRLLLLLIHDPNCPHSRAALTKMERAANILAEEHWTRNYYINHPTIEIPKFAKLSLTNNEVGGGEEDDPSLSSLLRNEYSITSVPTFMFVVQQQQQGGSSNAAEDNNNDTSSSSTSSTLLLEYTGLSDTALDIFRTVLHYYVRLVLSTGGTTTDSSDGDAANNNQDYVQLKPRTYDNLQEVQLFIKDNSGSLLQYSNVAQGMVGGSGQTSSSSSNPASPAQQQRQAEYLKWLLLEEEEIDDDEASAKQQQQQQQSSTDPFSNNKQSLSLPDDFVVLVQCRSGGNGDGDLYDRFDQMSRALSNRRDRFFAISNDCSSSSSRSHPTKQMQQQQQQDDGSVRAWKLPLNFFSSSSGATSQSHHQDWYSTIVPHAYYYDPNPDNLMEWIVRISTPSVMVLDRQSTGPIAFPIYRKVHAVLVVETRMLLFTTPDEKEHVRQSVHQFRRLCRYHQRRTFETASAANDMVCLIVPSSETRILMTLGVDIWGSSGSGSGGNTDNDTTANGETGSSGGGGSTSSRDQLPMLLITDQREAGTRRYYLDHENLLRDMEDFVDRFWQGQIEPELKSDPKGPRTNVAGVRILTADTIQHELFHQHYDHLERQLNGTASVEDMQQQHQQHQQHGLIVFTSPTCAHCKRFLVLWNRLSEFLTHIGWNNNIIKLYRMDISLNELPFRNLTVKWVPDMYYVPPPSSTALPPLLQYQGMSSDRDRRKLVNLHAEKSMVRFDWKDDMGDDYLINDTTDIVQFFLSVAHLTDNQLQQLLSDLNEEFEQ